MFIQMFTLHSDPVRPWKVTCFNQPSSLEQFQKTDLAPHGFTGNFYVM